MCLQGHLFTLVVLAGRRQASMLAIDFKSHFFRNADHQRVLLCETRVRLRAEGKKISRLLKDADVNLKDACAHFLSGSLRARLISAAVCGD